MGIKSDAKRISYPAENSIYVPDFATQSLQDCVVDDGEDPMMAMESTDVKKR